MTATLVAMPKTLAQLQEELEPGAISHVVWHHRPASFTDRILLGSLPAPPNPNWGTLLDQSVADELLRITNVFRVNHGAGVLAFDPNLTADANWKTMNMSGFLYMDHDTPDPAWPGGRTWAQRMATYYTGACGENLAYGYTDPQSVFDAWVSAGPGEGHYQNIVNPSWATIGISAAQAINGLIFWDQDFGANPAPTPPDPTDHVAPSVPKNLQATVNGTTVNLTWDASTDNVGVKGYNLYLDGRRLGFSAVNRTAIGGLSNGDHLVGVDAIDFSGNMSAPVAVTATIGSVTPPTNKEPAANQTWQNDETKKLVVITSVEPYRKTKRVFFTKQNHTKGSLVIASFKNQYTYVSG
jgi:uncharacterized protein YkwD